MRALAKEIEYDCSAPRMTTGANHCNVAEVELSDETVKDSTVEVSGSVVNFCWYARAPVLYRLDCGEHAETVNI